MRFTEHELTAALTGAAKTVLASRDRRVRKGRRDIEDVWAQLDRYQRFRLLDTLGDQLLPVLVSLPEVEVPEGSRPVFSDRQLLDAVEEHLGDQGGRLRRKAVVTARAALLRAALDHLPPRIAP